MLDLKIKDRVNLLRKVLAKKQIEALIVSIPENRYYLSGFKAEDSGVNESSGHLVITQKKRLLLTDSRFKIQALSEAPDYEILCYESYFLKKLLTIIKALNIKKIGFESAYLSYNTYMNYKSAIKEMLQTTNVEPTKNLVEKLRTTKSKYEIVQISESVKLAEEAFQELLGEIKLGMTEKKIAWIFEKKIRELGGDSLSFPIIVASGQNSAIPHAQITNKKIQNGEPILFDWGVKLNGYCSDTTRTMFFGSPKENFAEIYNIVYHAQRKALSRIKAGVKTSKIDGTARKYIDSTKYKGSFIHSLGHGTGLNVHESPRISKNSSEILKSGMVITVEPGIYLPKIGGIRLERQVVVTEDSYISLNKDTQTNYDIKISN